MPVLLSQGRYPLALAIMLLAGCGGGKGPPTTSPPPTRPPTPPPPADVSVTVQLDRRIEDVHPASGFIHSMSATEPPNGLVAPLRPRLWRSDLRRAPPGRVLALGARYEVVLSDLWGYPLNDWHGRGPPWRDLGRWERFVRAVARANRGRPLIWDVWNEPNSPQYFGGGRENLVRVFEVAFRALREELGPETVIGGPSISTYDPVWLEDLVRCCDPSFLSWHENLDPGAPISSIAEHLRDARAGPARGREIQVNESVGLADQYRPGEILGYLAALERGADYTARSCWGEKNCTPQSLDGLLAPGFVPRAAWWAYRWYAAGADARVEARAGDPRVAVLASGGERPQALIGRVDREAGPPVDVDVAIEGLDLDEALATVERLPDSGVAPLLRPQRLPAKGLEVEDGTTHVLVRGLRAHEAARVTITSR
jgi:xylan 1,4-beta-xylosidase